MNGVEDVFERLASLIQRVKRSMNPVYSSINYDPILYLCKLIGVGDLQNNQMKHMIGTSL